VRHHRFTLLLTKLVADVAVPDPVSGAGATGCFGRGADPQALRGAARHGLNSTLGLAECAVPTEARSFTAIAR
jgi:hypothetical protein